MDDSSEYMRELAEQISAYTTPLFKYIPFFEQKAANGSEAFTMYDGKETGEVLFTFPVYDSTLMNFVKEVSKTPLMDRNYPYVYSRNRIKTQKDEIDFIAKCTLKEWNSLCGILSKYVLGGRTKSTLWSEGVSKGIFLAILKKMKSILEFWGR